MIDIGKVTTRAEFDKLEPVWNSLLENSASRALALTWEWQSTWWEVFGNSGRELNILVARQGTEIVGIAPLLRRTVPHYGMPFTRLEFLGTGENEADEICSEYLDLIIRQGLEAEVIPKMLRYLYEDDKTWDEMSLGSIQSESPSVATFGELQPTSAASYQIVTKEKTSYIALPGTYADYFSRLGSNMRRDIRRDRRTAVTKGVELRVIDSELDFEVNFQVLVGLHEARWKPHGKPGAFASEKFSRFHRLLAAKILKNGWIKLFILAVSGQPIAGLYVFSYDNKLLIYQSGLADCDPTIAHPGTLVRDMAIEWAIQHGFTEWDMLRTRLSSYKLRWSDQARDIVGIRFARAQSKEAIYTAAARVVGGLRQIRRALV
jgi:CelD/BcsL family acetyltransferase involved in cellulose biosynthesis